MIQDIQQVQHELEIRFISEQDSLYPVLSAFDKTRRIESLTAYTVDCGNIVHQRWIELGEYLITKYNDGYIKDENGRPQEAGYPALWRNQIIKNKPEKYTIPDRDKQNSIEVLPY